MELGNREFPITTPAVRQKGGPLSGNPAIQVELGLDAEGKEQQLSLPEKFQGGAVQGDVMRLSPVICKSPVCREQAAKDSGQGSAIQPEHQVGEALFLTPLIQDRETL